MSIRELLSEERRDHQEKGLLPKWVTTDGWGFFKQKYMYEASSYKEQIERICKTAAQYTKDPGNWEKKFFTLFWNGWLSPSTPVLANTGTNRGMSVSCSGGTLGDSVYQFYYHKLETAILTKLGFGTSGYLGDIRPRGSPISVGGFASGCLPEFDSMIDIMRKVAQGTARRGAWAGYLEITHGDFDEIADYVKENPDDANIGWNITDKFIELLNEENEEALRRYKKALKLKCLTGKGYFFFPNNSSKPDCLTASPHFNGLPMLSFASIIRKLIPFALRTLPAIKPAGPAPIIKISTDFIADQTSFLL